jgi:hypothetical protein
MNHVVVPLINESATLVYGTTPWFIIYHQNPYASIGGIAPQCHLASPSFGASHSHLMVINRFAVSLVPLCGTSFMVINTIE